jgi:hypothetical protein
LAKRALAAKIGQGKSGAFEKDRKLRGDSVAVKQLALLFGDRDGPWRFSCLFVHAFTILLFI